MGKNGFVVLVHLWLDYFSLLPGHMTSLPSPPLLSSKSQVSRILFLYSKPGYIEQFSLIRLIFVVSLRHVVWLYLFNRTLLNFLKCIFFPEFVILLNGK